jgi:hypothetical protein
MGMLLAEDVEAAWAVLQLQHQLVLIQLEEQIHITLLGGLVDRAAALQIMVFMDQELEDVDVMH